MASKPWYKIDGLTPRADLREGKPLDASEFAVHLDRVRENAAPPDYQDPVRFFDRTYLTKYLTELAAQVVRRLSGEKTSTNAIFNLSTQFGGGKTHALTLLYHLGKNGSKADKFTGVNKILKMAEINTVPEAAVAVFVGTEFDSLTGRGGDDGTPKRKTPWGEIAYQLGGIEAYRIVEQHDLEFTEPKGDVIRQFLPKDKPCLILMDEIINYVSTYRKKSYNTKLYNFIQSLSEVARGMDNVVMVVSIPASELEYNPEDEADEQRFKKMLDRVGKAIVISAESETAEIIRRRLFEWDASYPDGKIILNRDAEATCKEYADWVLAHRSSVPQWFPVEQALETFRATYPFHPSVLSVFERKWQVLPRFQRTRGVLRLLALWVSRAYQDGFKDNHKDKLINLGSAPLDDPQFRSAILEQLGTDKLEGAITTDICGAKSAHAFRLDREAIDVIKKSRLHQKAATTIFFESNGGQQNTEATVPEIRLSLGEPNLDIANLETVLDGLRSDCYYLTVNQTKYRFGIHPNLNKMLADRRASIQTTQIDERLQTEIQKVFANKENKDKLPIVYFPGRPSNVPNQPALTLCVLHPGYSSSEDTQSLIEKIVRESGTANRTYKSALIFIFADSDTQLREETRKLLAWEDIDRHEQRLSDEQQRELSENLTKSERDLKETIWRSYKNLALLGKDDRIHTIDLGLITSSSAVNMIALILNRLRQDGELEDTVNPRFLIRNWSPAFKEWSTQSLRDAFFASPAFPRLMSKDAILDTIARGVKDGQFAYIGKAGERYEPFIFKDNLSTQDIEISDDIFLLKSEDAELYLQKIAEPPRLSTLEIYPSRIQIEPNQSQSFTTKGFDQYGQQITLDSIQWMTESGTIDVNGVLTVSNNVGQFNLRAIAGDCEADALFIVRLPDEKSESIDVDDINLKPAQQTSNLSWSGELTPQKWTQFYTKVLSKFTTDKLVDLSIKVTIEADGEISEQKINETITALKELGLNFDIKL